MAAGISVCDEWKARAELLRHGYRLELAHHVNEICVLDADFDEVWQFLKDIGYSGFFLVVRSLKKKKPAEAVSHSLSEEEDGQLALF